MKLVLQLTYTNFSQELWAKYYQSNEERLKEPQKRY